MRRFEVSRGLFGQEIQAQVLLLDQGIHISLFGGELAHIGAVSVVDPSGNLTTMEFPGHKEGQLSRRWASALAQMGCLPAVVEAGIHYDQLSPDGIAAVVSLSEEILADVMTELRKTQRG